MPIITRVELHAISQRRSQQDLLDLLPKVDQLLDELGAPSLEDELTAAATEAEAEAEADAEATAEPEAEAAAAVDDTEPAKEPAPKLRARRPKAPAKK